MAKMLLIWPLRIGVPAVLLGLMVVFIRFPLGSEPEGGLLRLSWRAVGGRVRLCEKYTLSEMEHLPKHMRISTERCSQSLLPYRLQVWWDGQLAVDRPVHPAGWRGDRPLFVNEEFAARPGQHQLQVIFQPLAFSGEPEGKEPRTDPKLAKSREEALRKARVFQLKRAVTTRAGRIVMVGLDEGSGKLYLRGG